MSKKIDTDITLYSYAELLAMKARHEAGRNKYNYAGPFTLQQVNEEIGKRNLHLSVSDLSYDVLSALGNPTKF